MPGSVYNLEFDQPRGCSFGAQLKEIIDFLTFLQENPSTKTLVLNLGKLEFVHPLFILPLAAISDQLKKKGIEITIKLPLHKRCFSYIKKVKFPLGLQPDVLPAWGNYLKRFEGKNYIPIINFPTDKGEANSTTREKLLSGINLLIKRSLELDVEYESAISYLISEITDNIIEHSNNPRGWLLTQYYPTTQYLDICIIDTGKTILGSYKDHGVHEIDNDEVALENALQGLSTKSIERGSGLRTSKAISLLGLKGDFAVFTGNALYYRDKILTLPVSWSGTFVAMRIKKGVQNFSLYSYV
jgi:hypothetical protein